jgi:hypothetical protein
MWRRNTTPPDLLNFNFLPSTLIHETTGAEQDQEHLNKQSRVIDGQTENNLGPQREKTQRREPAWNVHRGGETPAQKVSEMGTNGQVVEFVDSR